MTRLRPRCRRADAITSAVRPDAEIATNARSGAGAVGAPVDAYSTHADAPAARRSEAAIIAAYRELPRPVNAIRDLA